ncbi:hypothetical protein BKA66DRAFT_538414 [Pyrenochaeta sp. MPI-SDFR-AT-0127]|nr:hypothetical protein BKA66DRAFT_538414 [Pyrenochaeta sp. MPI-SDFR-AT-0127]
MSGLEMLSAISAVSTLLDAALSIIRRMRKAHEQQKHLANVLSNYYDELAKMNAILRIVEHEQALQTAAVASELVKIDKLVTRLFAHLKNLDPGTKGFVCQFAHQMRQGSKDEKELADIMAALGSAKSSLSLCIQVANAGLKRTVENTVVANAEVVKRIDYILQQVLGEGRGLKLAELLKNRPVRGDGLVPLSDGDIAQLSNNPYCLTMDSSTAIQPLLNNPTSRITINNFTEQQALQMNGPVGEKGWREVSHLEIRNNKANGRSIQINHGISEDVLTNCYLLELHLYRISV